MATPAGKMCQRCALPDEWEAGLPCLHPLVILMGSRRRWGIPVGLSERPIDGTGDSREASCNLSIICLLSERDREDQRGGIRKSVNRCPDSRGLSVSKRSRIIIHGRGDHSVSEGKRGREHLKAALRTDKPMNQRAFQVAFSASIVPL